MPGISEASNGHVVRIPEGTVFGNGYDREGDALAPFFEVATTRPVDLPGRGCVTAPARFKDNPTGYALTTRYPASLPSQLDQPGLTILGRVAADFERSGPLQSCGAGCMKPDGFCHAPCGDARP